jgi:hypothetical protein
MIASAYFAFLPLGHGRFLGFKRHFHLNPPGTNLKNSNTSLPAGTSMGTLVKTCEIRMQMNLQAASKELVSFTSKVYK